VLPITWNRPLHAGCVDLRTVQRVRGIPRLAWPLHRAAGCWLLPRAVPNYSRQRKSGGTGGERHPANKKRKLTKWKHEKELTELRDQLREEQRLRVQTLNERDEARQWESQALVARIQRDQFSKTLGEVREILCDALPTEDAPTSFMAVKLVKERDEARVLADRLAEAIRKHQVELPFRADFCDVELYEALATLKEARCES